MNQITTTTEDYFRLTFLTRKYILIALRFLKVHNGAVGEGGEHKGETDILLVDNDENAGAHLESLNSQTIYIVSRSLANGDLSDMVLMTEPSHTNEGEQVC